MNTANARSSPATQPPVFRAVPAVALAAKPAGKPKPRDTWFDTFQFNFSWK